MTLIPTEASAPGKLMIAGEYAVLEPGEPAIVELGPGGPEPESDTPGASQQIKPPLAPERTAQRVGSVAHIGGFFEALFASKLGDAIS